MIFEQDQKELKLLEKRTELREKEQQGKQAQDIKAVRNVIGQYKYNAFIHLGDIKIIALDSMK